MRRYYSTCMAEVSKVTVHSHYFQINKFGDLAKLARQWVAVHISQCLSCRCSLRSRHDLNDVRLLERQDYLCVSSLSSRSPVTSCSLTLTE